MSNIFFLSQYTKFFSRASTTEIVGEGDCRDMAHMLADWEKSTPYCMRALPKRLQDLLKAGNDNPQLYKELASCIETETEVEYDYITNQNKTNVIETRINSECLEPHKKSLGMSAYDAFLVRSTMNGTDDPVTEAKLKAVFSNPTTAKEFAKTFFLGSYDDALAKLVARIIFLLDG